ncbi:hypothetical protein EV702DRAFT_1246800 [Suillus placidus]|uniref:DUF6533 domain-containing protein n=1 Tax=Suillus placidus TaxID=48579 RepID=A0A9P6ZMN8_9AGAM|nr:hypothetical protein EV702DRAFT_1246800 [Suillus placidus]
MSQDPTLWRLIDWYRVLSYFVVASSTVVVHDWALTFGKEFELVWRRRWSLMTILYIGVRYIGLLSSVIIMLSSVPGVAMTDVVREIFDQRLGSIDGWFDSTSEKAVSTVLLYAQACTTFVVNTMLRVIIITRLYAMYQLSRKILVFLVVIFLAVTIAFGVMGAIGSSYTSMDTLVLSGTYYCVYEGYNQTLIETWILSTAWEVLALCLAVWVVFKHFRELQQLPTGWSIGDCFAVLIKTHLLYFTVFAVASCLSLASTSPKFSTSSPAGAVCVGLLQLFSIVQMFVVGPRLVLGVREHHDRLVANSDAGIAMSTITFQERVRASADNDT